MPHRTTPQRQTAPALKPLLPAPPRFREPPPIIVGRKVSFLDLPAELRIEIYNLILRKVVIHILPSNSDRQSAPHGLLRTCRQIRHEVLPIMHTSCAIRATITDFDFSGLLAWLARIPVDGHKELAKNPSLNIHFCASEKVPGDLPFLRRWLHDRADPYRPQPSWRYSGPTPNNKVANDLRRRMRRMKEARKQAELKKIVKALGVNLYD